MSTTTTTSKRYSLNARDFWRGLLMAVGTPVIPLLHTAIQKGFGNIPWETIGIVAASAGLMYLGKNFFTSSEIVMQNPSSEAVDAVKAGEAKVTLVPADVKPPEEAAKK